MHVELISLHNIRLDNKFNPMFNSLYKMAQISSRIQENHKKSMGSSTIIHLGIELDCSGKILIPAKCVNNNNFT